MALQHLRSNTANKRPDPTAMADGQLAINTPAVSPGLFFKDAAGVLVKVGPVHVGTTAPNASPASGGTAGNSVGEQWLDTTGGTYVFKVWDGSAWRSESGTFVDVNGDVMTGALGIIAGSAGSPGLYFSGDTNTGIYSPGADQVAISTNGTGRLFVDSNGKVGIGTATAADDAVLTVTKGANIAYPGQNNAQLHINNSTGAAGILIASSTVNNIFFADAAANNVGRIYYDHSSDFLAVHTNSSERMRLDSSGRLGLGTSSPAYTFDCNGDINIPSGSSYRLGTGTVLSYGGGNVRLSDTGGGVDLRTNNTSRLYITNGGNVGIGVNAPDPGGQGLHVHNASAADSSVRITNSTTGATNGDGFAIQVASDGTARLRQFENVALTFETNATERGRWDSNGRFLVGTSSARGNFFNSSYSTKLQIEDTGSLASASITANTTNTAEGPIFTLARANGTSVGSTTIVANGNLLGYFGFQGSDGTEFVEAASIKCEVDGTPGANDMPGRLVFSTTADGASTPTERMRIDSTGELTVTNSRSSEGNLIATFKGTSGGTNIKFFEGNSSTDGNAANCQIRVGSTNNTNRSINAGGTVNASGADYAEYMVKSGDFEISKGDICGITASGLLTVNYGDAVSFVVKSTNPSYVGSDTWGVGFDNDAQGLEAARQTVDRIAFAGQVPVNVTGATPGQYIVPVLTADGGISGVAKDEADLTLTEYMRAVGKVITIEDDGRARIIVKVA